MSSTQTVPLDGNGEGDWEHINLNQKRNSVHMMPRSGGLEAGQAASELRSSLIGAGTLQHFPTLVNENVSTNEDILSIEIEQQKLLSKKDVIDAQVQHIATHKAKLEAENKKFELEKQKLASAFKDIDAIDCLLARIPKDQAPDLIMSAEMKNDESLQLTAHARELLILARNRMRLRWNYLRLLGNLFFFAIYCSTIFLQKVPSYDVESSVILSDIMGSLPNMGSMSFFNGGGPGSTGQLTTNNDFYNWLNSSLFQIMYQDAVCGDGVCDSPEEVQGVGRFGCSVDCGNVPADTTVTLYVNLQSVILQRFTNKPYLGANDPGFRYNIFRQDRNLIGRPKHFNDYVFEKMMNPSDDAQVQFTALRHDELELQLFQINSLSGVVDVTAINTQFHIDGQTLPLRNESSLDWAYGDRREILAVSQVIAKGVEKYCTNMVGGIFNARMDDDACSDSPWAFPQGFPNYHTSFDMGLQLLASYGISGDVTVPYLTSYGSEAMKSLISSDEPNVATSTIPAVRYCSPLPKLSTYSVTTGQDFSKHIQKVGASCTATFRRSSSENPFDSWQENLGNRSDNYAIPVLPKHNSSRWLTSPLSFRHLLQSTVVPFTWTVPVGPVGNALNLSVLDIGLDDKGYWRCYSGAYDPSLNQECYVANAQWYYNSFNNSDRYGYSGAVFVAVDVWYWYLDIFQTDATLAALTSAWMNDGGTAPTLKDAQAELHIRYSVDGTVAHELQPNCSGTFNPPFGVKEFEYGFKTRLRLFNSSIRQLRVWLCNASYLPSLVSLVNVSQQLANKGILPLQPGPAVTLTVPLAQAPDFSTLNGMQQQLCAVAFGSVDERCNSRVWASADQGQAIFTFLTTSNSQATKKSFLLTHIVQSDAFRLQFTVVNSSGNYVFCRVYAPGPRPKLGRTSLKGCVTHYDCEDGLFCSARALAPFKRGFLGAGGPGPYGFGCDLCKYCLNDFTDPNDVSCPRDKCGLDSGGYPLCVDGTKLFSDKFSCPSRFTINMSRVPSVEQTSPPSTVVPLLSANSTARKARFLTPYNQLIGAVTISQRRQMGNCSMRNDSIARYVMVPGVVCRGNIPSTDPFGRDPAFLSSSTMYRGDFTPLQFYMQWELNGDGHPYGFYPHSYDSVTGQNKPKNLVLRDYANNFNVYFTEQISASQADQTLRFMQEGSFIDASTKEISVDILTFNANLNLLCTFTFFFQWQDGGRITWDYKITSIPVYLYDDNTRVAGLVLELLCVVLLGFECVKEFFELLFAVKMFRLKLYFGDVWNVIDLSHFGLMWTSWYYWLQQVYLTWTLEFPPGFSIMKNLGQNAARPLVTNADGEFEFLEFRRKVRDLSENLDFYSVISSVCVAIFVSRILKDADFQPRIALVTRTISKVASDLVHFFMLFSIVLLGYAIAGVVLFGHQYEGFNTVTRAIFYLLMIIIAFNPDSGWVQMNHAAPDWAFNLFLWTWFMISLFILLNVFLAILINGYTAMREEAELENDGILTEIYDILNHEARRFLQFLSNRYPFVSDEELVSRLASRMGDSHFEHTLQQYKQIEVSGLMEIPMRRRPDMKLKSADVLTVLQAYFPDYLLATNNLDHSYLNPALLGIMKRFGGMVRVKPTAELWAEKEAQFIRRLKLENAKRIARAELEGKGTRDDAFAAVAAIAAKGKAPLLPVHVATARLSVVVEKMRHVPSMDMFGGSDPYCVIFLEDAPGMFQTETRTGKTEEDWSWDPSLSEDFVWELSNDVDHLRPSRNVVIMVYDKDKLTSDDLIGCATVALEELAQGGVFDGWKRIVRPPSASKFQIMGLGLSVPEVKLRVTLQAIVPPSDHAAPPPLEEEVLSRPVSPQPHHSVAPVRRRSQIWAEDSESKVRDSFCTFGAAPGVPMAAVMPLLGTLPPSAFSVTSTLGFPSQPVPSPIAGLSPQYSGSSALPLSCAASEAAGPAMGLDQDPPQAAATEAAADPNGAHSILLSSPIVRRWPPGPAAPATVRGEEGFSSLFPPRA